MASRKKERLWEEAGRRCRLGQEEIEMAKRLGMNPRSLIKNIPARTEGWKTPVGEWVRGLYEKRFKKRAGNRLPKPSQASRALKRTVGEDNQRPFIWDTQLEDLVEGPLPDPAPWLESESGDGKKALD